MLPALSSMASLSSTQRAIGYTVTDQMDYTGVMFGDAGTYTIGAYMPASRLEDYTGCKIVGIRVAAAVDLGRTNLILASNTDDGVETLHEQKQRLYQGWNEVFFNGFDYEITGTEDIFYGFDYTETAEMVNAEMGGLCTVGEDMTNSFVYFYNGGFYSVTGAGKLCIQLIVDITNMAGEKMSIGYFDYGFKYKKMSEGLEIFASINNVGLNSVNNFRVACSIDGNEPMYETVTPEKPLAYGEYYTFDKTFPLNGVTLGGHDVRVYVDQINGKDFDGIAKSKGGKIAIYDEALRRNKTYFEVYADQNNPNTSSLDDGLRVMKEILGDEVTVVKNYRPGNKLAVAEGAYLHSLYAYTWPSFTSNRSHFPGETYVAYDMNDYLAIFPGELVTEILRDIAEQDLETPSFADLSLSGIVTEDGTLTVEASGNILPEAKSIYGDLALTIMVVEDGVQSPQQTSSGRPNSKYAHEDVLRCFVTPNRGTVIDSTQPSFTQNYTVTLPAGLNANNIRLTGILTQAGEANEENLYDFDVINTANGEIKVMSGIGTISAEMPATGFYNLQGIPVDESELGTGIYIRIDADGKARKVVR